jgi:hypothetical protein
MTDGKPRQAPQAVFNGYALHEFADDRRLLWVDGPIRAWDFARNYLCYSAEMLPRREFARQSAADFVRRGPGLAIVFWPSYDSPLSLKFDAEDFREIAAHAGWAFLSARDFLDCLSIREQKA